MSQLKPPKLIVKVQMSQYPRGESALVYDQTRKVFFIEIKGEEGFTIIRERLGGRQKAYFYAYHRKIDGVHRVELGAMAPEQEW